MDECGNTTEIGSQRSSEIRTVVLHRPEKLKKVSNCDLPIRWQRITERPLRALASRMQERWVEVRRAGT